MSEPIFSFMPLLEWMERHWLRVLNVSSILSIPLKYNSQCTLFQALKYAHNGMDDRERNELLKFLLLKVDPVTFTAVQAAGSR